MHMFRSSGVFKGRRARHLPRPPKVFRAYSAFKGDRSSNCKTREEGDASLLSLSFCVSSFFFPTFSVFQAVYHEYRFAFSVMSVML